MTGGTIKLGASGAAALLLGAAAVYFLYPAGGRDAPSALALGQRIYSENCASCHGADLEGQPDWQTRDAEGYLPAPPHDETGHTWHHPSELLFEITKYGVAEAAGLEEYRTRMPAFEGILTDGEIRAALAFIEAQWPEHIRERRRQSD